MCSAAVAMRQQARTFAINTMLLIFGAHHSHLVITLPPIMPLLVRTSHHNSCLRDPFKPIMLVARRLPPRRAVVPFPLTLSVRLSSKEGILLSQVHDDVVLCVIVNTRDVSAL